MQKVLAGSVLVGLLTACGGGGSGGGSADSSLPAASSATNPVGNTGTSTASVRFQAVLGPLVGATVEVSLLSFRGFPTASPVFTTTTRDGVSLGEAGTFEIPRARLLNDEIYVISISGGIDVDPDDDGVREPAGQEIDLPRTIHALATGPDLLAMDEPFRVSALTEVAYQVVLSAVPDDADLSMGFVSAELDRTATAQLVDASQGGDLNGDGVVNRLDLAHFRPAEDAHLLVLDEDRFRQLTAMLLDDTASGQQIASFGTTVAPPSMLAFPGYSSGTFAPHDEFQQRCEQPRGAPWYDQSGTRRDEKNWLRSWSNEFYLWFDEIIDADPGGSATTAEYFDLMKTTATTAAGRPRDRFHFTQPTDDFLAFFEAGVTPGYGAEFAVLSATPPRQVRVAYTEPNTPATRAGISRGYEFIAVDGVDVRYGATQTDVNTINAAMFSPQVGDSHTFRVVDPATNTERDVVLVAEGITTRPVQHVQVLPTATGMVGYLAFHSHIGPAEQALIDAVQQLQRAQVVDLVVDLRYNGGGYSVIAQQFASMVAGPARMRRQIYSKMVFNSKHQLRNPFSGELIAPRLFPATSAGLSSIPGTLLPGLNLDRVFVLTGPGTCSASEAFMNGLRGVGVEVVQIGEGTCGKPYGFYSTDNCGVTYSSIHFGSINAEGWGSYHDGFAPDQRAGPAGIVPGCRVADDLLHGLGDPLEARLASALRWRDSRTCPAPPIGSLVRRAVSGAEPLAAGVGDPSPPPGLVVGPPDWRRGAFLRP